MHVCRSSIVVQRIHHRSGLLVRSDKPFEGNAEHQRLQLPGRTKLLRNRKHYFVPHVTVNLFNASSVVQRSLKVSLQLQL